MSKDSSYQKRILSDFSIISCCLLISLMVAAIMIRGIVQLILKDSGEYQFIKARPLAIITIPEDSTVKKRIRTRPKPKEEIPQKDVQPQEKPITEVKPVNIKPIKMSSFKPSLAISGSFRIDPGKFAVTGPVRGLVPVYQAPPQYPYKARQRGQEGVVELEFTITKEGGVKDIKVVKASPPNVFDRAAIQAISRWRFNPIIVAGKSVEKRAIQDIRFQLKR